MSKKYEKSLNTFSVKITKEKSTYSAVVLGINDVCATQGKTYEEALENIQEALELYTEHLKTLKNKPVKSNIVLMPIYA